MPWFRPWIDWSSWLFGVRVDWAPYRRFVIIELGPLGLAWEFDDYPESAESEE